MTAEDGASTDSDSVAGGADEGRGSEIERDTLFSVRDSGSELW